MPSSLSFKLCLFSFLCLLHSHAYAQRDLKDIPPVDPELERATFVLPEGFEVNLFAADPAIAKPIQMNFDPQGRLWVVSSETYPQIEPGAKANDRVLILHDQDGDGVSDQTQVFAEGLLIPTGITPGDGGAYVGASTELLHFKDTDGDGKADERNVVLSGFGTEDTHHIVHTFRWGPEQLLYFSQSIYIHSHLETPWGVKRLDAGGIWQYRPETMELEVYARGLVNTWGTAFDKYGATFATDGAGGEGINYMVPGAYYVTAQGSPRILHGLNPGSPKHCGLEIVESEHLPADWQGSFITNDFRGHRVCRFVLTEDGAGYRSQEQQEVIKSNHVAFRPIDVKVGPDGAIYIADWYNPIIQHGEVDFRDERRDHTHGRIWRVTCKDRPLVKTPNLVDASHIDLLNHLASSNAFTRQQTKRVLKERGEIIQADLAAWTKTIPPENAALQLEALWMHQAVQLFDMELLTALLESPDHHVRAAATRVLGHWHKQTEDELELLEQLVQDDHPQVRLEAIRVLSKSDTPNAVGIALLALNHPVDQWIEYALWQTVRELQPYWEPAIEDQSLDLSQNLNRLTFLIQASGSTVAIPSLVNTLQTENLDLNEAEKLLNLVGQFGNAEQLQAVLSLALKEGTSVELQHRCLNALLHAGVHRKLSPSQTEGLLPLLAHPNPAIQSTAIRCLGAWKVKSAQPQISELASASQTSTDIRSAAITALGSYEDEPAAIALTQIATSDSPADFQRQALEELIRFRPAQTAVLAVDFLSTAKTPEQAHALFNAILARKGGAKLLEDAIVGKELSKDVAVIGLRLVGSSGQDNASLEKAIREAGKLKPEAVKLTPEQMLAMVNEVQQQGDPQRGEVIYRQEELNCQKCHAIGTAGGQIGSNLVSLGATAQLDYILESLLDPNAKVKEGFHTVVVATDEGQIFSGIKIRESDQELFLRDAEGKEISVPLKAIEQQKQGNSLMPTGVTTNLTHQEILDLTAFLAALGKKPMFTISTTPMIRHWDVMQATPEAAHQLRRISYASAATDDAAYTWKRSYSRVDGNLNVLELPQVSVKNRSAAGTRGVSFVRSSFATKVDSTIKLQLNDPTGLQLWLDGNPVDATEVIQLEVSSGTHQLTIAIDQSERTAPLKITPLDTILELPTGK